MKVIKLDEAGLDSALYGFGLSFRKPGLTRDEWWTDEQRNRIYKAALANAGRDKGHNKFLEHIQVWISVTATLEFFKQFDTYRIGVSKQSESTMHTLDKDDLLPEYFDLKNEDFDSTSDAMVYIEYLDMLSRQTSSRVKSKALPQAFLQEREVNLNYKVIRHINSQRFAHKLPDWIEFLKQTIESLENPELLGL